MISELSLTCQEGIREACHTLKTSCEHDSLENVSSRYVEYESEFGRMLYTISILLMFSFVIILLMVRSIKRTHSTVEMDALLDAMRFREELDIQDRQRRRLMKAKTKVTAWLNRSKGEVANCTKKEWDWKPVPRQRQQFSISTITSEIPEIVVSADDGVYSNQMQNRPHTPAISMIYDFGLPDNEEEERRKTSFTSSNGLLTSSSSSSIASSIENRSIKDSTRTLSLDTNGSKPHRRVDLDDKSFSLDA